MRQQLEGAQRDRAALAATKKRLAAAERQGRARDWELEVTQQQLEKVGEGAAPQTAAAGTALAAVFLAVLLLLLGEVWLAGPGCAAVVLAQHELCSLHCFPQPPTN